MTPDEYTISEKFVDVGSGHKIYTQLWGTDTADKTILHFHGGPGSATRDRHKKPFDPRRYRVLFFDQRGCGNSTYEELLKDNDTDHIIEDAVKVLEEHTISSCIVDGGSWGAFLALVFAIRHPQLVDSLFIYGIFTGTQAEIDYIEKGEAKAYFPDVWEKYAATAPAKYAKNPSEYHWPRILGKDEVAAKESAYAIETYEFQLIELDDRKPEVDFEEFDPTGAKIFAHILSNNCGVEEGYIFKNAAKIACPTYIIQGRYDMVCAPKVAYELSQLIPNSHLHWTIAGHSRSDRSNWDARRGLLMAQG